MSEKRLVPKRRFKGFEGEWEKYKFEDVVDRLSLSIKDQRLPQVEYDDLIPDIGRVKSNFPKQNSSRKGILFEKGDILFGKLRPYLKNWLLAEFRGLAVGDFWVFRIQNSCNRLVYYLIQTNKFQTAANLSIGTRMPRADWGVVSNIKYRLPSYKEQQKIGRFFKLLDERIANQEKKIAKVKALKSAYLSEMFPQEGETVPKRRFKGFEGEWKLKRLVDIADIVGGGTPSTTNEEFWNGNINWFSPTEIGDKTYVSESEKKITRLGLEKSSANLLPSNNTILFTSRASIGDMAILKCDAATNQGFQSLVIKSDFDVYYLYSMGYILKKFAVANASGSTFKEISGYELGKMEIKVPSFKEQQKIGAFFKNLDDQIEMEEKKLAKLKAMKEAYLEEMFV